MNKLLIALVVVTAGIVAWALLPAPERAPEVERPAPQTEAKAIDTPGATGAGASAGGETAEPARRAPPKPQARPKPAVAGDPTPRPARLELPRPDLEPPLQALPEGVVPNPEEVKVGRAQGSPMTVAPVADVKASMRRYYGNLPRSGRMPARIELEELLPPAAIAGLGVPARSQVVEIGHYPATGVDGLVEALELPDDSMTTLGITVVTPDGYRVRDYIQLQPAE